MEEAYKSKRVKEFFKKSKIDVMEEASATNLLVLLDNDGNELKLWTEISTFPSIIVE